MPDGYRNSDTMSEQRRRVGSPTRSLHKGDPMLPSLVYFVLRRLLHALAASDRTDLEREAELLVLGHQLEVHSRELAGRVFVGGTGSCSPASVACFRGSGGGRSS